MSPPDSNAALRWSAAPLALLLALGLLDQQVVAPLIAVIAAGLGVSVAEAGLAVSAYAVAASAAALLIGPVSDARGRRPFLLAATALLAAAAGLVAGFPGYASFLVARVGAGIAGGTIAALAVAWVGDRVAYERRGRIMALLLGAAMGAAILGQVGAAFASARWGHQPVYAVLAAGAALTLVPLAMLREPRRRFDDRALRLRLAGYQAFFRSATLRRAALAAFCLSASLVGVSTYASGWLQEFRGYTVAEVGLMYGGLGAAVLVVQPLAGPLADRFGKRRFTIATSVALALVTVTLPLLPGWAALVGLLGFGVIGVARMGAFAALRSELAGPRRRAAFLAFSNTASQIGIAAAAAVGSILYGVGFQAVCWGMAGFGVLAVFLVSGIGPPEADTPAAPGDAAA